MSGNQSAESVTTNVDRKVRKEEKPSFIMLKEQDNSYSKIIIVLLLSDFIENSHSVDK